jgi:ATP-dependent Clp protease protease subunit
VRRRQLVDELPAPRREYTGQKLEEIEKAMDRDKFLETDEAKAFGLIDEVFDKRPDAGEDGGDWGGGGYAGLVGGRFRRDRQSGVGKL